MMPNNNGYVTWRQFIVTVITITAFNMSAMWAVVQHHAQQPHATAVHVREFERVYKEISEVKAEIRQLRSLLLRRNEISLQNEIP